MAQKKILVYHPDEDLKEKIKRFSKEKYIISKIVETEDAVIPQEGYDYICISSKDYRVTKEKLGKLVNPAIIHTYEELRVLGSEREINDRIMRKWEKIDKANSDFSGKNVIVFGGGSGIGYSCAEAFVLSGANVIIAGRSEERLRNAAALLGSGVSWIRWDITDVKSNNVKFQEVISAVDGKVDIVVNSAGLYDSDEISFLDMTEDVYDKVMDTNIKGPFFLCQKFSEYFIKESISGHIVNIVSETGNSPTVKPYGLSKWALWGFTKGLGLTLAKYGITVNGVAPGEVATDMTGWGGERKKREPARRAPQTGRLLFSREVAEVILFLAGKAGTNMPGEIILYNGGSVGSVYRLQLLNG